MIVFATYAAGLVAAFAFGYAAGLATIVPAYRAARLRAEAAELHVRILSADRKAN